MITTVFPYTLKTKTIFLSSLLFIIIMSPRLWGSLSQGASGCALKTHLTEPLQRHKSKATHAQNCLPVLGQNDCRALFSWKSSYIGLNLSYDTESQKQEQPRPSFFPLFLSSLLIPSIDSIILSAKICLSLLTTLDAEPWFSKCGGVSARPTLFQQSHEDMICLHRCGDTGNNGGRSCWHAHSRGGSGTQRSRSWVLHGHALMLKTEQNKRKLVSLNLDPWEHISLAFCVRNWGDIYRSLHAKSEGCLENKHWRGYLSGGWTSCCFHGSPFLLEGMTD